MKDRKESFGSRISGGLFAVASSILTNIIYDELSGICYEVSSTGDRVFLVQVSEFTFMQKMGFIGVTFFAIWFVILAVWLFLPKAISQIRYKNIRTYSRKQIVSSYREAKKYIIKIKDSSNISNDIILYTDDIAIAVNTLHKVFCPTKKSLKRIVNSVFRTGATIFDMGQLISPYEYSAVIESADKVLRCLSQYSSSEMLQKDCTKLKQEIIELKEIVN